MSEPREYLVTCTHKAKLCQNIGDVQVRAMDENEARVTAKTVFCKRWKFPWSRVTVTEVREVASA
jgi:hypothetical protein